MSKPSPIRRTVAKNLRFLVDRYFHENPKLMSRYLNVPYPTVYGWVKGSFSVTEGWMPIIQEELGLRPWMLFFPNLEKKWDNLVPNPPIDAERVESLRLAIGRRPGTGRKEDK